MSTLSQFGAGGSTATIVNAYSSGGAISTNAVSANASTNAGRELLSGALTAGVLKDLLVINGRGQVPFLSIYSKNTTSRTLRLVVIVDGVTVFDATSSAATVTNTGILAAGRTPDSTGTVPSGPIRFNTSLQVRVASSLTETDFVAIGYLLT